MAITRVQGTKGTSSTATTTISLPSAPTSGNLIVLRFASDDYNGTPDAGWTQSTGMEQQTWHGSYLWWRVSNGTNSFAYTIGSASGSAWILEEWSGLDGTAPYDVSNGTFTQATGSTQTTPAITPTAGDRLLLASMGGSFSGDLTAVTGSFDSSFTTDAYQGNSGHATDDWVMAGHRVVTGNNGSTAYSTTGTASINLQTRSGLIIAFKAAATGGGTVTGTMAATEAGSDTASFSGSVKASGSLAATESGADTASFSGTVSAPGVSGTLSATETGSDTASFSGSVQTSGSLAATESGSDTAAFAGSVTVSGSLAATGAGTDTASFTGSVAPSGTVGTLAATETGQDSAAISGSVSAPPAGTMTVIAPSTGQFVRSALSSSAMTLQIKTTGQFLRVS